jgi:hypothetical protein
MHDELRRPVTTPFCTLLLIATASIGASGCVHKYEAPLANQPHAIVKIRRAYATHDGETLTESAFIGKHLVLEQERPAELDETQTTAVRVHPGPVAWRVGSAYTHTEMRRVQENYSEQVPYTATETYSCGTGTNYKTCTRTVTRYRYEQKTRWVNRQVTVTDAECTSQTRQLAEVGHVYLLQYSYTGPDICSLVCLEQAPRADGQFDSKPCAIPAQTSDH